MAPKQPAPSPLMAQAAKIKFQLNGIILEGNHVFSTRQLLPLYEDYLHKTISVADLFNIVQDITNYYRNSGYIISRAILPPQHVKNGIVHIQIIEGYIGNVVVTGHPQGAKCLIQGFGRQISKCRPLEISRMEKYLTLANEIPATGVKAVLSPSKNQPGAADLTLVTEHQLMTGYVSYDNYGTLYIGPQQMTANLGANSLFSSGDSTQMTFTKTPKGGELTYTDINYNGAIDTEGNRWVVGATRAHTHPLFVLQPTQVDGVNMNYYTNVQFPIIRTRTKTLTIMPSFNYLDSEVNQFGNQQLYTDHLRSLGVSATYNFSDSWYGANLLNGEIRQGLPIFGYTTNINPATAQTSRPGGRGDYTKIDGSISRLQAIKGPFSLYGLIKGQWAFNPLLASEQFTYGGSQLGRGYDVAEIIGDKGAAASLEARYDWGFQRFYISNVQFYAFYDAGAMWNYKNVGGVPTKQTGLSTGFGARFYMTRWVSGNIMWAQPLTKQVLALTETSQQVVHGIVTNRGNGAAPRVFFSVVAQMD
jgi:hemolysin activation/secretion protein